MKKIEILNAVGDFAEDKDAAATVRENFIRPALDRGEAVVLDFSGVTLTTQSFVHALISDILRSNGEHILEKIDFKDCSAGVRGIIETVVQYSLETLEDDDNANQ